MSWKGTKYFIQGNGADDWFKAWGNGWRIGATALILFLIVGGVRGCFVKEPKNVNKPHVTVAPFGKVEKIDQTSTQINVEPEKTWEIGLGGGALQYDNKTGGALWAWIKKKW